MVDLKKQQNRVCACLETIKTNQFNRPLSKFYDMRLLQACGLYFNHGVFFCAMALLNIISKTRINFIYVNITYVYVTEFTLAEPT